MEEGDKSIGVGVGVGVGGESCSSWRVLDDGGPPPPSWLCVSRQRFTIELRPGETTIVSWKRLVKDAQITSPPPPLTAPNSGTHFSPDECLQDDKSAVKPNGLPVNSHKSECIDEPVSSVSQQSRKRSQDMAKALGAKVDDSVPIKHAKLEQGGLNFAATNAPLEEQSSALLQSSAVNTEHDQKLHTLLSSPIKSSKKQADIGTKSEHSSYTGISKNDASLSLNSKDADKYKSVTIHSRDIENIMNSGALHHKSLEKNSSKSPVRKSMTDNDEVGISTKAEQKEKRGTYGELPDLNLPAYPVQSEKTPSVHSKDVSCLRPKGTMLERAIRELEKVVAESRLANMEVDASSAAIKRRLPREVKLKLAKVARLAQSSQGKISEELINRLMNILGHSVQLRTLKRNLRAMVLLGLSAKRERADRFQQIKLEVTEMIKLQASKQRDITTDDSQEVLASEERYRMDNAMEDKICDLYDLYFQGVDEDKGPQVRKLYAELVELWPNGIMDKHRIKNAIRRAKDRRRALCDKVREKHRRMKSAQQMGSGVRGEASSMSQFPAAQETQTIESSGHVLALPCRTISCTETADQQLAGPLENSSLVLKASGVDICKQEKVEKTTIPILKEQLKRQQRELENRAKKISLKVEKESRKSHKRAIGHPDAATYELAGPPSCGRPV